MCRVPHWECLIVDLPSCDRLTSINLSHVDTVFECQQIWSYMNMAIVLFSNTNQVWIKQGLLVLLAPDSEKECRHLVRNKCCTFLTTRSIRNTILHGLTMLVLVRFKLLNAVSYG